MKLFVLLPRVPFPLEKGDKLRAYHQLRYLSERCEVHLCCLNDTGEVPASTIEALRPYCTGIHIIRLRKVGIAWNVLRAFLTGKPLQVGYFFSLSARRKIHRLIRAVQPDHIYCQLLRVAAYVKDIDCPKTLDYQDIFSKGFERQAAERPALLRPFFIREARKLAAYEQEIFSWFNHHTIISEPDRVAMHPAQRDQVAIIHNGVDTDYFIPVDFTRDTDLLFTGNMNYLPNVVGAEYLIRQILPLLVPAFPGLRVLIAGASPSKRVHALKSDNVFVSGWMEDIRAAFACSRIFVAPMTIGTGLQNKLLEAMAMKIPCVTSPLAFSALGATAGQEILVCNNPREYADAITHLLSDPDYAEEIADRGFRFVKENYDWKTETDRLYDLMMS